MVVDHLYTLDEIPAIRVLTKPENDTVTTRDRDGIGALAATLESMDPAADTLRRGVGRAAIRILQQPRDLALKLATGLAGLP